MRLRIRIISSEESGLMVSGHIGLGLRFDGPGPSREWD
jgi:hypothetical protein